MTTTDTSYANTNTYTMSPWGTASNTQTKTAASTDTSGTSSTSTKASSTDSAIKGLGDNFNSFLRLLTTQMQNQDPTKPMDTNEMTQQLVQFATVEQSIGTNSRLDKLLTMQQQSTASTNLAYLGRTVVYKGDTFAYADGMTQAPLGYELDTSAKSVRVDILDSQGRIVRSMKGETEAGTKHTVSWDFKDDNGNAVQPGTYRLNIAPTGDQKDQIIKATTYTFGTVSGIDNSKSGEMAMIVNGVSVPWSEVDSVR